MSKTYLDLWKSIKDYNVNYKNKNYGFRFYIDHINECIRLYVYHLDNVVCTFTIKP